MTAIRQSSETWKKDSEIHNIFIESPCYFLYFLAKLNALRLPCFLPSLRLFHNINELGVKEYFTNH